ncbi:hypothetical protein MNBD_CHLOROFLEXI01-3177 [hydrothermal vent metagenome]|uniref:Nudix hydrolase domain-containing protein n=1 Tax=hydrothermal vent metagenome TaxID=652676 RepID=A0A3B0W079_9ZZZZ
MTSQSSTRYHVVPRTLCFVLDGDELLLIKRAPHKRLFPGKINGLGGHVEHNEDIQTAVIREIKEEAGIDVKDLWLAGVINIDGIESQSDTLVTDGVPSVVIFVFIAQATSREVQPSEEGELIWASLTAVHQLDWVGGKPDLLLQALEAWREKRPFFTYRKSA